MLSRQISPFARELTALFVEDDGPTRAMVAAQLRGVFRELILASDGQEGLAAFRARSPQLVLTDNWMPVMSGIEMTEAIRKVDARVPVIFITSSMDIELLVRAINLGISAFISKPVAQPNLRHALTLVVGMLENEHLQRKAVEQELALHAFREKYHEHQQALAFRKELRILENDFRWRCFSGAAGSGRGDWIAQVVYSPHDIMCGDSYALRRLPDGMLVLIADAMGKGLGAALTTALGVHGFNFLVDGLDPAAPFRFEAFVERFTALVRKHLLEDEVFPLCLAWLPASGPELVLAAFGMPPILVDDGREVRRVRCNNPPVSPYAVDFSTTAHDLGGARAILLYTDGLNEAVTAEGNLYRDNLEADFARCAGQSQFWKAFQARVGTPDDDVTLLLLSRVDAEPLWRATLAVPSRLEQVERACQDLEQRLEACPGLDPDLRGEFAMALREAVLNAYEHGSLAIPAAQKARLLEEGLYYQHLREREGTALGTITVDLSVQAETAGRLLRATVQDEGQGFSPAEFLSQEPDSMMLSGRGLKMVRKYTDAFYFNETGNAITLLRYCQEESDATVAHGPA